jgi:hypothetical protein
MIAFPICYVMIELVKVKLIKSMRCDAISQEVFNHINHVGLPEVTQRAKQDKSTDDVLCAEKLRDNHDSKEVMIKNDATASTISPS